MKKSPKPIPQHITDFLDWLDIERGLSPKSQENYARFIQRFLVWLKIDNLDNLKPHDLSPEHIWKYRVFLSRSSSPNTKNLLKKTTQNYYLIALRSLLNYFAEHDILSLPAEKIKLAKNKNQRQVRFLSLGQLKKLFSIPSDSTIQGLRDRAILEVFFSTGLRVSELVALNRDQFKFKLGIRDLELSIIGKGGVIRTVYFSERALGALNEFLKTRADEEKALFVSYRARAVRRLTSRSIQKMIKKYALLAGLPATTTPHVMRHSFATDLLSQGVDLRNIQEFLGHRNISATQIYAHVTSKKLREIHRQFHGGNKRYGLT